jgi:hypothetical protein
MNMQSPIAALSTLSLALALAACASNAPRPASLAEAQGTWQLDAATPAGGRIPTMTLGKDGSLQRLRRITRPFSARCQPRRKPIPVARSAPRANWTRVAVCSQSVGIISICTARSPERKCPARCTGRKQKGSGNLATQEWQPGTETQKKCLALAACRASSPRTPTPPGWNQGGGVSGDQETCQWRVSAANALPVAGPEHDGRGVGCAASL